MAIFTPLYFLLKNSKSVKKSITPGLLSSIFMSLLFVLTRKVQPVCQYLPNQDGIKCKFEWREVEMFIFYLCLMVLKNRTAVSVQQMITSSLTYSKLANAVLFYRVDPRLGIAYSFLCLVRIYIFPENFVDGPEEIIYFSDKTLEETLAEDRRVTWMIAFYTTWSPPCHAVMPAFACLSNEYATDFFRFGKVDVGKYPKAAER
ncbi:unnamed protein product [Clavelina lepadiformis]|uniref:Thioredoxin domain-containing protein n=1 Tax=Clavelina lepadiformis TaxID=159417 RepID=A0ABP0GTQ5_CLALP